MPFVMEILVEETRVCVNGRRRRMRRWRRIHNDLGEDYTFNKKAVAELVLKIIYPDPEKCRRVVEIERVSGPWPQLLNK